MSQNPRLVTFLYLIMRDAMPVGAIIQKLEEIDELEAGWLEHVSELDSQVLILAHEFAELITQHGGFVDG